MRKSTWLSLILVLVFGGAFVWAGMEGRPVPQGQDGKPVSDAGLSGCIYALNTTSAAVSTTSGMLYWIAIEEGATSQDYIVYDSTYAINAGTCTSGTNCTEALPPLNPRSTDGATDPVIKFDPPIRMTRGISVDATDNGAADDYTVCYVENNDL